MSKSSDLKKLKTQIQVLEKHLNLVKDMVKALEESSSKSYKEIPGIEGVFDGFFMLSDTGEKYEVPANYAAKSKIVFGDRLKMIQEDDKTLFKQINKVEQKEISGILTKKEGKWYILTDAGSYRISDTAAGFQGATANCEAIALIPKDNLSAPFAALKKVIKEGESEQTAEEVSEKKEEKRDKKKKTIKSKKTKTKVAPKKRAVSKPKKSEAQKETTPIQPLDDDDLR